LLKTIQQAEIAKFNDIGTQLRRLSKSFNAAVG